MRVRQILMVAMVLSVMDLEMVSGADGWVPTSAAVHFWPVAEGGNGHAYQPVGVPELIPWTAADQIATLAGGYLATITSQAENDFVYALSADLFVQAMGNHYGPWLGGYQLPGAVEPAGGWTWVTGEPFAYTAWAVNEPSQTAGPLNEDRLHYLGHGGPEPTWNDQTNSSDFGPTAYVIEYDPVTFEAEDAPALPEDRIETTFGNYSGAGYVRLGSRPDAIRWTASVGVAESKALLLRYSNGTSRDIGLQVAVNGAVMEPNLLCAPTGGWDIWASATVPARFQVGENVVEVRSLTAAADLALDKLTVFGDNTNVALNHPIAFSAEAAARPAGQAVDADTRTCWRIEGLPQWLEVDLGDVYPIHGTQVVGSDWQACQFRVEVKREVNDAYVQAVDRTNNLTPGTALEPISDAFDPIAARYVRLTVTGADWGDPEIAEFRISAATGQAPAIAIGPAGYRTIQAAIDAARPGDMIVLQPGRYAGAGNQGLALKGKQITLASIDPNDSRIVAATVLSGTPAGPALSFTNRENADCLLAGLTICGAQAALYCNDASPTIRNCRLVGNGTAGIQLYGDARPALRNCLIAGNRGPGIAMDSQRGHTSLPQITNCTIVENLGYGIEGGKPTVVNSIIYFNGPAAGGPQIYGRSSAVTYSDVQGGWPGEGNLDSDPCFARGGSWDNPEGTGWAAGDYHLRSQAGRWEAEAQQWLVEAVTSPCIDAGEPAREPGPEPPPNGGRLNLGVYGGTREASLSP
jgi:hypothetical protein